MKRIVLMTVLALALPLAAFGDQVEFLAQGGTLTLTGSSSGLTLTGSIGISEIIGLGGKNYVGGGVGTITLTTGPMISTNQFAAGGSIVITGSGNNGGPKGVLFTGTFNTPPSWNEISGQKNYDLLGNISGIWYGQGPLDSVPGSFQLSSWVSTGGNGFKLVPVSGNGEGGFFITPALNVPEPGTLGLLSTGLAAFAVAMRCKLKV